MLLSYLTFNTLLLDNLCEEATNISDQYAVEYAAERKTLLTVFKGLFEDFEKMILSSEKDTFPPLVLALKSIYSDFDESLCDNTKELLQYISGKRECFSDYFFEVQVIRTLGSNDHRETCEKFERGCDRYFLNIAFKYHVQLSQFLEEDTSFLEFILDRGEVNVKHIASGFQSELSRAFSISRELLKVKYGDFGMQFLSVEIPGQFISEFIFSPLYANRVAALKNENVQFFMVGKHKFYLTKWRIFLDKEITVDKITFSYSNGHLLSVKHKDASFMALEYLIDSSGVRDKGYVQYLESILNGYHKYTPSVKGLYYPKQNSMLQYPWVIMEKCESLMGGVKEFPVKEVNQVSFLLDIVRCIREFDDQSVAIKVNSKSIFVDHKNGKFEARFCPFYGYSYQNMDVIEEIQVKSLAKADLQWMADITKYLQNGNENSELPKDHIMKKLLEQKWLSGEDRFRPQSYRVLCEDLEDFYGKFW